MTININLPDIGTDKVEVTEILVKPGDQVKIEQSLITVEGDKVSMEIPSPQDGIVKEIKISVGDKIETGSLIMTFDSIEIESSTIFSHEKQVNSNLAISSFNNTLKNIYAPFISSNEAIVTEILVQEDEAITKKQPIIIIGYNSVSMEVPSPFSGIIKEIKVNKKDKIFTNSLIMTVKVTNTEDSVTSGQQKVNVPIERQSECDSTFRNVESFVHASPSIRRIAREFSINLIKVTGSGRKGRILREDIRDYIVKAIKFSESDVKDFNNQRGTILWSKNQVDFSKFGDVKEVALSSIQRISGANLSRNWSNIPHVTHFDKVNISDLEMFRKKQNDKYKLHNMNIKITVLVFIIKAVSDALEKMPRLNSSLSESGNSLILKKYINIGIAVDTPSGLLVPVLKNINKKGIVEIATELKNIIKKARAGELISDDMKGGCFTISSIGSIGTTYFTPIINAPEVAILGVSKSFIEPIWNGKDFSPNLMLPFSLSFDHRVIDGADGARFIAIIKNTLNDIRQLIM